MQWKRSHASSAKPRAQGHLKSAASDILNDLSFIAENMEWYHTNCEAKLGVFMLTAARRKRCRLPSKSNMEPTPATPTVTSPVKAPPLGTSTSRWTTCPRH